MSYYQAWLPLAARIRGLTEAAKLHAQYLAVRSNDSYGRAKHLRSQAGAILAALGAFRDAYRAALPEATIRAIEAVIAATDPMIRSEEGTADTRQEQTWAALVLLATFETELSFLLTDAQDQMRSRTERAFAHLQRLIVADDETRQKWQAAFARGEISCERLGAVQLLQHGIWAFKVNAAGERTDLVYQQPAGDLHNEQGLADGFILTEWKKATPGNVGAKVTAARSQAKRYAVGGLGGIELAGWRYLVVLSERTIAMPDDVRENDFAYRHINIAVDPEVPSRRGAH